VDPAPGDQVYEVPQGEGLPRRRMKPKRASRSMPRRASDGIDEDWHRPLDARRSTRVPLARTPTIAGVH
jgi:hypothetical protein